MSPLFSYYGAKYRSARHYPAPRHDTIVEPFAGSAGYSARYADRRVILVEKNPTIAAVLRYLIGATRADIMALPLLTDGERIEGLQIGECERALIGFWVGKARVRPGYEFSGWARRYRESHPGYIGFWGERCRARLAEMVERIKHWTVIEGDFTDAPDIAATWFIDPPYAEAGKWYPNGSADLDFDALGKWVLSRRGQVIACEASGASWLPFDRGYRTAGVHSTGGRGEKPRESFWTNERGLFSEARP